MKALLLSFFPERQTLMHAKAVLFINDDQRQAIKLYLFLENRMCADDHRNLAAGDGFLLRLACFSFLLARQPAHFNPERREPVAEIVGVLFGEQFRGRHQRRLLAVRDRAQRGKCCHQRFARADIALNQPHHGNIQRHIALDFRHHAHLRAGGFERQRGEQLLLKRITSLKRLCVVALCAQHAQVMGQQLFQN
ncbi:Transcription-repair coupling factor [Cronobacter sakazakii 696]|nr:Transcription-repair coupling factor [Cronobacter sakazakii 696]